MKYKLTVIQNNKSFNLSVSGDKTLWESLLDQNIVIDAPCGGMGTCGKCRAKLLSSAKDISYDNEYILLCKTYPSGDMKIEIYDSEELEFLNAPKGEFLDVACDIGTTTVELSFVDKTGTVCAKSTFLNPERAYGADVISRIKACQNLGVDVVRAPLINKIESVIKEYQSHTKFHSIDRVVFSANTVMTHILLGISPSSMAFYPYKPALLDMKILKGEDVGIPANTVTALPSLSAFFGSDALVGLSYSGLTRDKAPALYLDLGTNGEIALFDGEKIYCTSTAVGPAFEGGNISIGIGAIKGAIYRVEEDDDKLNLLTVQNGEPCGICGAGIINLISYLKNNFKLNSSGEFTKGETSFKLNDSLYLSQKDVREFQLTKSAIRTGIEILLKKSGISASEIQKVYIAGGLGKNVDIFSLFNCGVLPVELRDKCVKIGNSSLLGTVGYLKNDTICDIVEEIKRNSIFVNLAEEEEFKYLFTENLNL